MKRFTLSLAVIGGTRTREEMLGIWGCCVRGRRRTRCGIGRSAGWGCCVGGGYCRGVGRSARRENAGCLVGARRGADWAGSTAGLPREWLNFTRRACCARGRVLRCAVGSWRARETRSAGFVGSGKARGGERVLRGYEAYE